jgi:hypothetical protein
MNKTIFEEKYEEGLEKGKAEGIRGIIVEDLEERFGVLSETIKERLQEKSLPELKSLRRAIRQAKTLTDLGLDK